MSEKLGMKLAITLHHLSCKNVLLIRVENSVNPDLMASDEAI